MTFDNLSTLRLLLLRTGKLHRTYETEAPCLAATIETLKLAGAVVNREAFSTRRGTADVIACYKGRYIALECKSATGVCSRQQLKFMDQVRSAGGIAKEVSCMNDVLEALLQATSGDENRELV